MQTEFDTSRIIKQADSCEEDCLDGMVVFNQATSARHRLQDRDCKTQIARHRLQDRVQDPKASNPFCAQKFVSNVLEI